MSTCRLFPEVDPPDPAVVAALCRLPVAIVSDVMERTGGAPGLLPLTPKRWSGTVGGPALTVKTRAGDNLVVHKALDIARPGDVLVVDAGGATERAIVGEIMVRYAIAQGIAAIVIDGAVRDVEALVELPVPVFARGVSHLGPYKDGPGEIRGPVALAGTVVTPTDVIIGDADGIAVVRRQRARDLIERGGEKLREERQTFEAIDQGTFDRSWVDQAIDLVAGGPEAAT